MRGGRGNPLTGDHSRCEQQCSSLRPAKTSALVHDSLTDILLGSHDECAVLPAPTRQGDATTVVVVSPASHLSDMDRLYIAQGEDAPPSLPSPPCPLVITPLAFSSASVVVPPPPSFPPSSPSAPPPAPVGAINSWGEPIDDCVRESRMHREGRDGERTSHDATVVSFGSTDKLQRKTLRFVLAPFPRIRAPQASCVSVSTEHSTNVA